MTNIESDYQHLIDKLENYDKLNARVEELEAIIQKSIQEIKDVLYELNRVQRKK